MTENARQFYDELADSYHLLFEDWDQSIARQGKVLDRLLRAELPGDSLPRVLDATCGIGTQALGLAALGYAVDGADLSPAAVARTAKEARLRGLRIETHVADLRTLGTDVAGIFDVVLACDNSLPHLLDDEDLRAAARGMRAKLRPDGLLVASIRDYEACARERPRFTSERTFGDGDQRRIVFQVWDWTDERRYTVHQFILRPSAAGWSTLHFESEYRALRREELGAVLRDSGFVNVRWLEPTDSGGYYQPIVMARRGP